MLLDAQATGMPVISTTHCDIPDEVRHNETGLLSPEKDIEALAQSIKRFYEMDDIQYHKFSQAARKHMELHYDVVNNSKELAAVYRKLAESFHH